MKQGEMEVVCLSQTYQVALCCLLHHDLRQYCAPYNDCNAVVAILSFSYLNGARNRPLSYTKWAQSPQARTWGNHVVDEAELLFMRYLCMCEQSVALFAVACVLVVWCIPKPVQ